MIVGNLLVRGLIVGLVAGLLGFAVGHFAGEVPLDKAIAYEEAQDKAKVDAKYKADVEAANAAHRPVPQRPVEEPPLVSRATQAGPGLLIGMAIVGTALGGIFAIVFAFAYGRIGPMGPRATSAVLAVLAFVAIFFVPNLKYPSNPPGTSETETIGARTGLYFSTMVLSIIAMVLALMMLQRLRERVGGWNASILAALGYAAIMALVMTLLPTVMETPENFSAVVMWQFRLSTIAMHMVLWAIIGLGFGALCEPAMAGVRRGMSPVVRRG